ncbi:hypothetical protein FEM48_Zijuj11G0158100 [Ziziphus jujuba var. spinosa]|uniref:Uncharacterized protein n=1 Tax=Ziziphus jujuba var. spinosa TaxID=714518 RepID=A0A978UJU9_ZIZJJ|nr:hypothetical protein FEM48_Zijuj11G0158100 [Ziziphus jujuba var. spinosa]
MASSYAVVDDKDLDDAALWAVIDSAAARASHSSSKFRKPLAIKYPNFESQSPISNPSPPLPPPSKQLCRTSPADSHSTISTAEDSWPFRPPRKIIRTCSSELNDTSPLVVFRNVQHSPTTNPAYFSPESYLSPEINKHFHAPESSPRSEDDKSARHSLSGRFPTVSLFKEYQNAAMAILEKTDYIMLSGNPFIKKSGWRKIAFYFNLSFEIKDKSIEFDENRNVLRAEFVVRAYMQGGRFSDGWGSCERREKRFHKPNHDIPSTAETRAKNKACQDLLGIGEYRPGAGQVHR